MRKGKVVEKFKRILISIMCVVTLVFAMPVKAKAGIFDEFVDLILRIPDGIMWIGNRYLADRNTNDSIIAIGLEGVHGWKDDDGHIYNFFVTPYDIFTAGEVRTYKDTKGNERTYRNLPIFYANFFNTGDGIIAENDENALKSNEILRPALGNIYIYLRDLCLVLMMLVLLYIGIKIIISSVSTEQAKYKQMLIDWLVGVSLLFLMHYIMSFIMNINDIVVDMLKNNESATYYISFPALGDSAVASNGIGEEWYEFFDDYNEKAFIDLHLDIPGNVSNGKTWEGIESGAPDAFDFIEKNDVESGKAKPEDLYTIQVDTHTDWGDNGKVKINAVLNANDGANSHRCVYRANLMEYIRTLSSYSQEFVKLYTNNNDGVRIANNEDDEQNLMARMGYGILYLTLVVETIMFVVVYIKRLLQLAMLTMISPLVAFMYPIDKIGDGKAQAFNTWLKDYVFNVLIQPLHLLIYTIFITAAMDLFNKNIIYAIAIYAFMIVAEKYFKKIFGFDKSSTGGGGPLGGALGAGMAMHGLGKLTGLGPPGAPGGGKKSSEGGKESKPKIKKRAPATGKPEAQTSPNSNGSGNGNGNGDGRVPGALSGGKFSSAKNAIKNTGKAAWGTGKKKISKALTGGKYDGMKGRKRKFLGAAAKNIGGKGAKLLTRAGTTVALGSAGLLAGAATAMATGDVNNLTKGIAIGTAAGWKNGKNLADWGGGKIGGFIDDTKALRAKSDQNYADKIRIEEAKDSFDNSLTSEQKDIIEKYAPYVDFNGDEDKLEAFIDTDKAMGGIEADNIEQVIAVAKDSQRFGNLNESSKQEEYRKSLIKEKMNEENAKIGNEPGQVSEDEYLKKAGINADNLKEEANKLREAEEAKISDARRKELAEAHQAHDKKEVERVKKKYEKKYNELKSDESKQKFAEEAKKKALQTAKEKNINMDEIDKKIEVAKSHYNKVTK